MGCHIEPSPDGKYIIQVVTGDLNCKLALAYNLKSHDLGRKLAINRFLVDLTRSRNVDTLPANFCFARFDLKNTPEIDPAARVALLVSPGDRSHNIVEKVSRNSGLDMTIFTDRYKAKQHLLAD